MDDRGQIAIVAVFRSNFFYFILLYLIALTITVHYALFEMQLISDQLEEYKLYLLAIQNPTWHLFSSGEMYWSNLLNSCPMITHVPAWFQIVFHLPAELWFKLWPCLIYSLTPAFIYLSSRRYMDIPYSILSSGLVLCGFFFLFYPAMGRVSIAWGLLSGLIWAMASRRIAWATIFAVSLPFSHYGTSAIGILLVSPLLVTRNIKYLIPIGTLIATFVIWDFGICEVPYQLVSNFVKSSAVIPTVLTNPLSWANNFLFYSSGLYVTENVLKPVIMLSMAVFLPRIKENFTRKSLAYAIFVLLLLITNFSQFLLLVALASGVYLAIRRFDVQLSLLTVSGLIITLLGLFVPYINDSYGPARCWFTAILAFAPSLALGIKTISDYFKTPRYLIFALIILLYGVMSLNIRLL